MYPRGCYNPREIELGNKPKIGPSPRTPSLRSYVEMNERKVKSPNSATGHHQGHSQQRSITPHQRGQTPPQFTGRGPEEVQQQYYSQPSLKQQLFSIPPPQPQGQGTVYTHELNKQSQVPNRLPAPGAGLVQPTTMYQQQQSMRPQTSMPFFRQSAPPGNVMPNNQYAQIPQQQTPQQFTQQGMTYQIMTPSNMNIPGQNYGTQIIMQPSHVNMQASRMNNSQYPNMGNQQSMHFTTMGQPTNTPYYNNPTMMFPTQPSRPPSNPAAPEKRVKKTLSIVDPNTGKDLTSEILHTKEAKEGSSHRSTPPSGPSSGSRGTPDTSAPQPTPHNSDIAAQFAAQVAATLRSEARTAEHADMREHSEEPQVDSSTLASEVPATSAESETLTLPVNDQVDSEPSQENASDHIPEAGSNAPNLSNSVSDSIRDESSVEHQDSVPVEKSETSVPITGNEPPSLSTSTETASDVAPSMSEVEVTAATEAPPQEVVPQAASEVKPEEQVEQPKEKDSVEEKVSEEVKPDPPVKETEAPVDVKKSKKKAKDLNKKDMSGTDMDAFMDSLPPEMKPTPDAGEQKENVESVQTDVPKIEIKIEDKVVQEENEKNQEKDKQANLSDEEEKATLELKYKYKEDQWSPLNPEGKRLYDRDFLLSIQYSSESTQKPAGLPDLPEIILDKPHSSQPGGRSFQSFNTDPGRSFDFTPGFVRGPSRVPPISKGGSNSQRSRGGGATPRKVISIGSISQEVNLHKAESAWKPARKKDQSEIDEDTKKTEELYKKVRSILNKLTPQRFQTLVKQVSEMEINTEERLKGVTDLIFEKAISEPGFSVAYASMCRYLAMIKVPSTSKSGEFVNFRAILLTRCQKEFEKDKDSEKEMEERRKVIEETQDAKKKEELIEELNYSETKARRRSLGNIRFIGELFNLKMLTENIMHDCLFKLLRAKDEESLECLCRLLSTIGKELDSDKAKPRMDQYFNQMDKIVIEKKTSSRVRFMLQDVIDLRKCKWVPRRDDNNPKTLDQIHKEAQKEEQERQIFLQQATAKEKAQGRGGGGARGSRGPPGPGMGSSDGWNTVGKPNIRVERQSIDPSRLKITKQNLDESNIQLGPGGGTNRFSGWQRGSTGGGARNSQEQEKPNAPANRFSALSKPEDDSRGRFGTSPARGDSRGRGSGGFGRPQSRGITPRSSMEQEKERALAAVRDVVGGQTTPRQGQSRESSRGREPRRPDVEKTSKPAPPVTKELTEQEMEKKTKAILDEYLHVQDIKEAMLCVEELKSPAVMHTFVSTAVNYILERSSIARSQTGLLLHDLVKKNVLSVPVYIQGLTEILQFAEDMEIDIPKIWQYFGELIGPMVQDGSVPLNFLRKAAEPLKENNKAGLLVAEVLHAASHREGHKKVGSLWRQSSLQWDEFMPANSVDQFIKDKKLEFTAGDDSQPSTPTVSIPMEKVQEKLQQLLTKEKADNEAIFDWIEESVDDKTIKGNKFIRALMTAVCDSAISGVGSSARVNPEVIKTRGDLLQKYLDHQAESELQALYALQALVHKLEHPQGVLRTLFDTLYDEDIISEDGFNQWEKSKDPNEQEGKGVAMKQVVQFFTWLREAEDMSDS
ncbi:eukaryotic translation initiation factor 4 gamma 1-like isoform X2 [Saccostrea cucullata]|uniref:eukaryotic translation initiation factor 4 gamma 1-like isoform X2 n=1 Tax=Saccostrea cuccullata TaxID=36930 RepID=UPI002ED2BCCE